VGRYNKVPKPNSSSSSAVEVTQESLEVPQDPVHSDDDVPRETTGSALSRPPADINVCGTVTQFTPTPTPPPGYDPYRGGVKRADEDSKIIDTIVFVRNLHEDITEERMRVVFTTYGKIDSCILMSKCTDYTYGFVEFSTRAEAEAAVQSLNGKSGLFVEPANNSQLALLRYSLYHDEDG